MVFHLLFVQLTIPTSSPVLAKVHPIYFRLLLYLMNFNSTPLELETHIKLQIVYKFHKEHFQLLHESLMEILRNARNGTDFFRKPHDILLV